MGNTVFSQVLMSILRYLIAGVAAWLVSKKIIDPNLGDAFVGETAQFLLGLIIAGGLIFWAWFRKQTDAYFKRNLAIAGADRNVTRPEEIVANAAKLQAAGSKPGPIIGDVPSGPGPTAVVSVMMALFLTMPAFGCGNRVDPNDTPDKIAITAAKWGQDAVQYVRSAQQIVSAYATAQGGRTPETDAPSMAIQKFVIPAAERLSGLLKAYQATSDVDLRTATSKQILTALSEYEKAVSEAIGTNAKVPPQLASQLASTVTNVRDLIVAIRSTFGAPATATI